MFRKLWQGFKSAACGMFLAGFCLGIGLSTLAMGNFVTAAFNLIMLVLLIYSSRSQYKEEKMDIMKKTLLAVAVGAFDMEEFKKIAADDIAFTKQQYEEFKAAEEVV